jgi:uncharacterized lipoprotein YddW (UPF0748 family)
VRLDAPPSKQVFPSGRSAGQPIKAVWVTRWDYKNPADIARVMENCKTAGFNTVLFQVRGNGTVAYRSRIEPWADEFEGRDPGFDPLKVACKEAHGRGMELHAWANVMPGWRGDKPPANPRQLYNAHPDWFWRDESGRRQPLGWYVSVNPVYPEVRQYLVSVMREIVANYDVDGLHLDYIRFPNEWVDAYGSGGHVPDYPRDPKTLAMFRRATGKTPDAAPGQWDSFRTGAVTQLVHDIKDMMKKTNKRAVLSAAVGATPDEAKRRHFQDARTWIDLGFVDAVYPMNYESDMGAYSRRLGLWRGTKRQVPVVTGIMFDKRDAHTVGAQVHQAVQTGGHFAAFAYNSMFERTDGRGQPVRDDGSGSRAAIRQAVVPQIRRM